MKITIENQLNDNAPTHWVWGGKHYGREVELTAAIGTEIVDRLTDHGVVEREGLYYDMKLTLQLIERPSE